jgi:hypothetical protein
LAISPTCQEIKSTSPLKTKTPRRTAVAAAITWGNRHFLLRKETIGLKRMANKMASNSGKIKCCPTYNMTMIKHKLSKVYANRVLKG